MRFKGSQKLSPAISELKKFLKESETTFRLIVEKLPNTIIYIAALDERSTTLYISPQVKDILGYTQKEYEKDPDIWAKCIHPDDYGSFEPQFEVGTFIPGKDDFWVFDAAIGYRLPKRLGFITVGAKNLFDKSFKYFDSDYNNPAIQPDRLLFVRLTLAI